jgi:hypothetical protein
MGNSMRPFFLCFRLWLEKPLHVTHPQAAGAATATDSIRGGKTARKGISISMRATVTPDDRFASP